MLLQDNLENIFLRVGKQCYWGWVAVGCDVARVKLFGLEILKHCNFHCSRPKGSLNSEWLFIYPWNKLSQLIKILILILGNCGSITMKIIAWLAKLGSRTELLNSSNIQQYKNFTTGTRRFSQLLTFMIYWTNITKTNKKWQYWIFALVHLMKLNFSVLSCARREKSLEQSENCNFYNDASCYGYRMFAAVWGELAWILWQRKWYWMVWSRKSK